MPESNGTQKQASSKPSLLRRLFGGPISESTAQQWPELAASWSGREIERPNETAQTNKVRQMNLIERSLLGPDTAGVTWPWGTIALNRGAIEKNNLDLGDTLVHELTHIGQGSGQGILRKLYNAPSDVMKPYHEKSYEKEAFDNEHNRPVRHFDINLPSNKNFVGPINEAYAPKMVEPRPSSGASGSWKDPYHVDGIKKVRQFSLPG